MEAHMFGRLAANWVYGGALAAIPLLFIAPILAEAMTVATLLAYLALPAYMIHQFEEHDDGAFGIFINGLLGPERRGLDAADIFWINFVGVWIVLCLGVLLAHYAGPGWAALAAYFLIVNGLAHVGQAIGLRRYNPGLVTAVALFLTLGPAILFTLPPTSMGMHLMCLGLVVLLHAAIILHALKPPKVA